MKRALIATAIGLASLSIASAQQPGGDALPKGFKTTPILKASKTASDHPLAYPTGANPEIISVFGELEPGGRTARHQHPVPVFVYVLEGALTVQADGGPPREYKPGQAYVEDINHWHQAFNRGTAPTKILVVFSGAEGKPTTINAQ
jgi:quercetin dioxygenase-like cupin family protein